MFMKHFNIIYQFQTLPISKSVFGCDSTKDKFWYWRLELCLLWLTNYFVSLLKFRERISSHIWHWYILGERMNGLDLKAFLRVSISVARSLLWETCLWRKRGKFLALLFPWTNIIQNVFQKKKKVLILLYEEKIKSSITDTHSVLQWHTHHVR